jgi:hypothetical protein
VTLYRQPLLFSRPLKRKAKPADAEPKLIRERVLNYDPITLRSFLLPECCEPSERPVIVRKVVRRAGR